HAAVGARVTDFCVPLTTAVNFGRGEPLRVRFEPIGETTETRARRTVARISLQKFGNPVLLAGLFGIVVGELPGDTTDQAVVHPTPQLGDSFGHAVFALGDRPLGRIARNIAGFQCTEARPRSAVDVTQSIADAEQEGRSGAVGAHTRAVGAVDTA